MKGETMTADNRLRELLHEIVPPPEVPNDQVLEARAALHSAYGGAAPTRPYVRRRSPLAWAGAAVAAAVVAAAALVLPGSSPSVDAALAEIAEAARVLEVTDLPEGSYVYSRLELVALTGTQIAEEGPEVLYLFSETVDQWVQGGIEERRTTVNQATFFDSELEDAYYAAGRDTEDGIGETFTTRHDIPTVYDITNLSDDPSILREQIADELATSRHPDRGEDILQLLEIEQLLDPRFNAPPALRAALIEIVGSSDVATTKLADGSVRVSLPYEERGNGTLVQELEFDMAGYLRVSRLTAADPGPTLPVPPGTVIELSTWSRPGVVDAPGEFPAGS